MVRALLAVALVLTLTAVGLKAGTSEQPSVEPAADGEDGDLDDEDVASLFTIVVVHPRGWRCSGSLVSQRAALTSAWCARGRGLVAARGLLALAAAALASPPGSRARRDGARRVARLVFAIGADAEEDALGGENARSWVGATADVALVELEAPFGSEARARPILTATSVTHCAAPDECHVARVLPEGEVHIVNATLQRGRRCADAAAHWIGLQEYALCLTGPEFCPSDWGSGVVCGGKLCGVLSRSMRAVAPSEPAAPAAGASDAGCGETHAAQSVPHWRRFLHCALKAHACKRSGDCKSVCNERGLLEEERGNEEKSSSDSAEIKLHSMDNITLTRSHPPAICPRLSQSPFHSSEPRPTLEPCPPLEPATSPELRPSPEASLIHASRPFTATIKGHDYSARPATNRRMRPSQASTLSVTHTTGSGSRESSTEPRAPGLPVRSRVPVKPRASRPRTLASSRPTRSSHAARSSAASAPALRDDVTAQRGDHKIISRFEFEPNRPDFKAGEYGDNVADYGSEEVGGSGGADGAEPAALTTSAAPAPRQPAASAETIELSSGLREEEFGHRSSELLALTEARGPPARSRGPVTSLAIRPRLVTRTGPTSRPTRTFHAALLSATSAPSPLTLHDDAVVQPGDHKIVSRLEFEPNRADFKAGEYGDNAADYGSEEVGGSGGADGAEPAALTTSAASAPRQPAASAETIELSEKSEQLSPVERQAVAPRPNPPTAASAAHGDPPYLTYFYIIFLLSNYK